RTLRDQLGDLEYQLSADVASVDHLMRAGSIFQRKHVDRRYADQAVPSAAQPSRPRTRQLTQITRAFEPRGRHQNIAGLVRQCRPIACFASSKRPAQLPRSTTLTSCGAFHCTECFGCSSTQSLLTDIVELQLLAFNIFSITQIPTTNL